MPFMPSFVIASFFSPAELYAERLRGRKILLENPAKVSRAEQQLEDQRSSKRRRAKNKLLMKRKDAKLNGIWKLEKGRANTGSYLSIIVMNGLHASTSSAATIFFSFWQASGVHTLKDSLSSNGRESGQEVRTVRQ
ncbi:hypothetical protein D9758_015675 [Tetrapyrgos nigripes]|uniref:Uncharacterized protein n=1 Tax=Tetrapyrgos nigripes TaxID=182062 RepID=A0A8H5FHE7_9AGAR|nr:hypothetical protein D9758_015675 [Tetrapyrgos nigripes]